MTKTLLCIGYGFSARALTPLLHPLGWTITGTTRSAERAEVMRAEGVIPMIWPGANLDDALKAASHLLISAAPSPDFGDPLLASTDLSAYEFDWVGYLSTTGVYGNHDGAWVDEATPLTPSTGRGTLRVAAESAWQATGLPLHIFRLAGIYGPGRGPFFKVRNGSARRIIKAGQMFSRIHVDDIAQVVATSFAQPRPGAVYNLCDNDPAPPQDVLAYAAELLGLPLPPEVDFESAEMTTMARSFYADNKRVRNDLIKSELGVQLKYPSYKEGLQSLLKLEIS
ncbi:MAG: SDR family oxidoreductase [Planktomarina sp.]|nr:SDR family oxidoreductase [Planktomarina sp.]